MCRTNKADKAELSEFNIITNKTMINSLYMHMYEFSICKINFVFWFNDFCVYVYTQSLHVAI